MVFKKIKFTFPVGFEILIWLVYVGMYKYSYHLDKANLPKDYTANFPYLQILGYSICTTLYLIPYYRWAVPRLLEKKWYWLLFGITFVLFGLVSQFNDLAFTWLFALMTKGLLVNQYFTNRSLHGILDFNLMLTDLLAFFCIAFARFSYQNEVKRHQVETDHLQLQLGMLKAQLQPHFLFNTLNGLYALSLTGSKDTPRFILLLSQMMQYILYDCDKERVPLQDEITFLQGYFELEQKKFPEARITFIISETFENMEIPPLLFLPLVENSFKHGKHKLQDEATVEATLTVTDKNLQFSVMNDKLGQGENKPQQKHMGIGLSNIKQRLELYYPKAHEIILDDNADTYIATVNINYR